MQMAANKTTHPDIPAGRGFHVEGKHSLLPAEF
jgi:hypothetical protein